MSAQIAPEPSNWQGSDVTIATVAEELCRVQVEHLHDAHNHAVTRTLNLIVSRGQPIASRGQPAVEQTLATLGWHNPSRTVVLCRHQEPRLDARIAIDCWMSRAPGEAGYCHDRIKLIADDARLEHAESLVAPLLVRGLPTVLWLCDETPAPGEEVLLGRAEHAVLDSGSVETTRALRRAAALGASTVVHDLAWGRLEHWRALIAASFDAPDQLALLAGVETIEIDHGAAAVADALLLAGWIVARLGWSLEGCHGDGRRWRVPGAGPDGADALITIKPSASSCADEIERVRIHGGETTIELHRGAASHRLRNLFADALPPAGRFARGYAGAVEAAAALLREDLAASRG